MKVYLVSWTGANVEMLNIEPEDFENAGIIEYECVPYVFQYFVRGENAVQFQEVNKIAFLGGEIVR